MSLVYIVISPCMRKYLHSPEDVIRKGLSDSEITRQWLKNGMEGRVNKDNAKQFWRERWWQPLVWCSHIIQENESKFTSSRDAAAT